MAKKLQLRRGTTTQHGSFTGDVGECTVDTDKDTLVVHDNSTQGGFPLLREDLNNLADDAVTYAKLQNVSATDRLLGRDTAGAGNVEEITPANVRTMLNVADGANNYSHPNHSGDVTSSGDGATTIADDAVTYAKMQNVTATDRILGRSSANAGVVEEITCTAAGRALLDDADAAAQRTTLAAAGTGTTNNFSETQSSTPQTGGATIDMSAGNFIEVSATNPSNSPTNLVVGTSGVFYADTAAPTSWHSTFKHPGGAYTAPTSFPAMAPWYIAETDEILVGSWTQGIA